MLSRLKRPFLVLCAFSALFVSAANAADVVLVANNNDGTISVIDSKTMTLACTLNANPDHAFSDKYADDLALSKDGTVLYVSRAALADVVAFHLPDMAVLWKTPIKGFRSDHLVVSPDGARIFVAAVLAGAVQVLEAQTGAVVGEIPTGRRPHALRFSPDGKDLLIGEMIGNEITVADATTLIVKDKIPFSAGVRPYDVTADGRTLYTQLSNFHGFLEYDLIAKKILNTIDLPKTAAEAKYKGKYPFDAANHGLTLSPDEKTLCVAATVSDYVALISRADLKTQVQIPTGSMPGWTINSLDGENCVVTLRGSNEVTFISYKQKKEVARVKVGAFPQRAITANVPAPCPVP